MDVFTRQLKDHEHDARNRAVDVFAGAQDPETGASRQYRFVVHMRNGVRLCTEISFHSENAHADGQRPNGVTPEAVLAALIDQVNGLDTSPTAVIRLEEAMLALKAVKAG